MFWSNLSEKVLPTKVNCNVYCYFLNFSLHELIAMFTATFLSDRSHSQLMNNHNKIEIESN